jgi:hypothetical protein
MGVIGVEPLSTAQLQQPLHISPFRDHFGDPDSRPAAYLESVLHAETGKACCVVEIGHHRCSCNGMTAPNLEEESLEAARALHRSLARAALSWNVDPKTATHNPVFVKNGKLNYYYTTSMRRKVSSFLRETGVLQPGFNGADRLAVPLDQIDGAADAAFERGIDIESMVEALMGLLEEEFGSFGWNHATFPEIELSPDPRARSLHFPDEREEVLSVLQNLQILGYVQVAEVGSEPPRFQWAPLALPILKRLYFIPIAR